MKGSPVGQTDGMAAGRGYALGKEDLQCRANTEGRSMMWHSTLDVGMYSAPGAGSGHNMVG